MPRLFLHVGLPKTATTTIQTFLTENYKSLANHGLLYPKAGLQHNAHHPFGNFFRPEPLDWVRSLDPKSVMDALHAEMGETGCDDIIISTESLTFANELGELKNYLSDFDVYPTFFLRRQDQWIQAIYRQSRKNGGGIANTSRYLAARGNWLDYHARLTRWARVFGSDKIKIAIFDKGNGRVSVEKMFLETIGAQFWDDLVLPGNRNGSLSRDCLAYLSALPAKRRIDAKHFLFFRMLENYTAKNPDPPKWKNVWSPAERLQILDEAAESNALIAREFLGREDGVLFPSLPPSLDDPWEAYPGLSAKKSVAIGSFLANRLYARLEKK